MRPETKAVMQVEKIAEQNLICKYSYFSPSGYSRCNRKATYFIIIDGVKRPACTEHKNLYGKNCVPVKQLEIPFPRS